MNASAVTASATAREVGPWVARTVRVGYGAKGLIYILIGALALRVAAGLGGGRLTDSSGALVTILGQPFGNTLLLVIGVGLLTYAGWQVVEGLFDTRWKGRDAAAWLDRGLTVLKGVVYGGVGWEATRLAVGLRGSAGNASQYAADVLRLPLGEWLLVGVGVGVGVYGAHQVWTAARCRLGDDLDAGDLRRSAGEWAVMVSRAGQGARGVILVLMGLSLVRAGFERRASEAGGTGESLQSLVTQPAGPWLLGTVAVGLVCYGVFQLLHARYARL